MGKLPQWSSKALFVFGFCRGSSPSAAHFLGFDCAFLHGRQLVRNVAFGMKIISGNSFPCPINVLLVPMSLTQCLPLDTHGACGCGPY